MFAFNAVNINDSLKNMPVKFFILNEKPCIGVIQGWRLALAIIQLTKQVFTLKCRVVI